MLALDNDMPLPASCMMCKLSVYSRDYDNRAADKAICVACDRDCTRHTRDRASWCPLFRMRDLGMAENGSRLTHLAEVYDYYGNGWE